MDCEKTKGKQVPITPNMRLWVDSQSQQPRYAQQLAVNVGDNPVRESETEMEKEQTENLGSSLGYVALLRFRQIVEVRIKQQELPKLDADSIPEYARDFGKYIAFEQVLLDLDRVIAGYKAKNDADIAAVNQWLNQGGQYPGDVAVMIWMHGELTEWMQWRQQGMDTVASQCADNLAEMSEALKSLI